MSTLLCLLRKNGKIWLIDSVLPAVAKWKQEITLPQHLGPTGSLSTLRNENDADN